jgi:hypothetical protein
MLPLTIRAITRRAPALIAIVVVAALVSLSNTTITAGAPLGQGPDRIDAPANGASVSGNVEIRGRATGPDVSRFSFYRILIGEGKDPTSLRPLGPPHDTPIENGVLATWGTDRFPAGEYTLILQVYDVDQNVTSASTFVTVAAKPTPTPLPLLMPSMQPAADQTPVGAPPPAIAPPPASGAASAADGPIPLDLPTPIVPPTLAPLVEAPGPGGPGMPINPIPIDPAMPPPVRLDTPAQTDPAQLPFAPAPVYITPIDFTLPSL